MRPAYRIRAAATLAAALFLAACAGLLPRARNEVASPWSSFEDARAALERIVPYETTGEDLRASGLDPYANPNIQLLTYSDIVLRFPNAADGRALDRGLADCLHAGKSCRGYAIAAKSVKRDRIGDFWLDALNFKRTVEVTGWSFNAIVLLVDQRVVYTLYGGQPRIHELEVSRQPLGPLQNFGEALPDVAR